MLKRYFHLKKWHKITLISLLALFLIGFVLYQYAVRHASAILEELVHEKSNGTVALKVTKVKLKWFKNTVLLANSHLYNTDRSGDVTKYDFFIEELSLKMTDVLGLVLKEEISINEIMLFKPRIVVETSGEQKKESSNLSAEAGNVFSSIQDGLKAVQVDNFYLRNGSFTLIQATDSIPVSIHLSQFNLQIDNFNPEKADKDQLLFSDNIYFETFDQNLIFPDGKYQLLFKKLSIGTQNKFIQLDSCTIANVHKNKTKGDIDLHFDTLRLTGIDFNELYLNDFITADSMYGKNALLDLKLDLNAKPNQSPLDSIFSSLGADIDLRFVGIDNLSTKLKTNKNGKESDFSTKGDDIAIQNLSIRSKGKRPFEIERFEMALRDYTSYTADSLYQFKFDSIKFVNRSVVLSNLRVNSYKSSNVKERYKIPQFVLNDLNWEDLLTNQQLHAKNATLYQPDLYFNQYVKNTKGNSKSVYEVFSDIRQFMYMDNIKVVDGSLAIHSFNNTSFLFDNVNCKVSIDELLRAQSSSMIESAVEAFQFDQGTVAAAGLNLNAYNVVYNPEDTYFHIDSLFLLDTTSQLNIEAHKVWLHHPYFDELNSFLQLDSLKWERGSIDYTKGAQQDRPFPISVFINYIQGQNTSFNLEYQQNIGGFIQQINAFNLEVNEEKIFKIQQVDAVGKGLNIYDENLSVFTSEFEISDHQASKFKKLEFTFYNRPDTLKVLADEIDFMPGNTNLKNKKFEVKRLALYEPTVIYNKYPKIKDSSVAQKDTIEFFFNELVLLNPFITYHDHYANRIDNITWKRNSTSKTDSLSIRKAFMKLDKEVDVNIQTVLLNGNDITINESFGIDFTYLSQPIRADLRNIEINKAFGKTQWQWKAYLNKLEHKGVEIGSIGLDDGNLLISEGRYYSLWLQNEWLDPFEALSNNPQFSAIIGPSSFAEKDYIIEWDSLSYFAPNQTLNIYEFNYQPSVSLTEFLKTLRYQKDYIVCRIPKLKVDGLHWWKQHEEWWTRATTLSINNMNLQAYRDKHAPLDTVTYKNLPVETLRKLNTAFTINEIKIQQSAATYSELGWNRKDTGVIHFEQLTGSLKNVKNFYFTENDSLQVDAQAKLLNYYPVGLYFKQAYQDMDNGFTARMIIGEGELKRLNDPLNKLANFGIRKGLLQELTIQVTGNNEAATGEAFMRYKKLKVRLNQKGRPNKSFFKTILANTFVIKNNNKKHHKAVYVDRIKYKSIFNYLVRIVFNSATTTMGVTSERANKKKAQQQVNNGNK
ncbi:AsmA family protein [Gynurincola endophyticus]|uniref:hypothetical protein n=1 Tax=Gynurincola endophyticus TaxID=2479004 RepID=UPI000F8EE608|nr:hypothetical protein [Gynurincola endophyticus]